MRVLVACEYSGRVRDAFIRRGHEAMSCDLLPTDVAGPHYQGDVAEILNDGWDLMIAHPPCTHLAVSGARWFKDKQAEQAEALAFVRLLLEANIPRRWAVGKFRKKPVVIEATQWFKPGDHPAVVMKSDPNRYADAGIPWIETLESGHVVTPGDWIITGVKGEHYPCKPDIFAMTYEPADDTQHRGDSRGGEVTKVVPTWTCRACGHSNQAADEHCAHCGEYHPATLAVIV